MKKINGVKKIKRVTPGLAAAALLTLAPAASATLSTVASPVTPRPLGPTNGNNVVASRGGTLHAVYADAGTVYYVTSRDGLSWSAPVALNAPGTKAEQPTLADDSYGNLGAAYVQNPKNGLGDIVYTYLPFRGTSWSKPVPVDSLAIGLSPSLAGYRGTMHLAYDLGNIYYTSFPTTSPAVSSSSFPEWVTMTALCGQTTRRGAPSVAVTRRDSCDSMPPIVRVAYFTGTDYTTQFPGNNCGDGTSAGIRVQERPLGPPGTTWLGYPVYVDNHYDPGSVPFSHETVSLASNRMTGENFLAFSYSFNGGHHTKVARGTQKGTWNTEPVLSGALGTVHVAADPSWSCGASPFRLSVAEIQTSGYGDTWHQTGTWPASDPTPAWSGPPVYESWAGRDAQSVFWEHYSRKTNTTTVVHTIFEHDAGPHSYSIVFNDTSTFAGASEPLGCLDPCPPKQDHAAALDDGWLPWDPGDDSGKYVVPIIIKSVGDEPLDVPLTVEAPLVPGVDVISVQGPWMCEIFEDDRLSCLHTGPVLAPGEAAPLVLELAVSANADAEQPFCLVVEPVEDDRPGNNRVCLQHGSTDSATTLSATTLSATPP